MSNQLPIDETAGSGRLSASALLPGTDGGICSTCHLPAATLINGKCTKHVVLSLGESGQLDLLAGPDGARTRPGGSCRPGNR